MIRYAILFSGGGSQYVGMGKYLYSFSSGKEIFDEAADILNFDLKKVIWDGPISKLSEMEFSQPAIFTSSVACYHVIQELLNPGPVILAGHSLGEFGALHCAGALTFKETLKLVQKRGELLSEAGRNGYTMAAVNKLNEEEVTALCDSMRSKGDQIFVAVHNSTFQHVVSGASASIEKLKNFVAELNGEVTSLNIATPSHSPLMVASAEHFREYISSIKFNELMIPVVSNLTGLPHATADSMPDNLVSQMLHPVQWQNSMNYLNTLSLDLVIETGPQGILKELNNHSDFSFLNYSFDLEADRDELDRWFNNQVNINDRLVRKALVIVASTKNYSNLEQGNSVVLKSAYSELLEMKKNKEKLQNNQLIKEKVLQIMNIIFTEKELPMDLREDLMQKLFAN